MEYGLLPTTLSIIAIVVSFALAWRLPNIITALLALKKKGENSNEL